MRTIVFISILILGLCGCKQQANQSQAKEITEQDFAILAVRCIRALETKYKERDYFNLVENVGLLCKESGMKKVSDKELLKEGLDIKKDIPEGTECSGYLYMGKDSLVITTTIYDVPQLEDGMSQVNICVTNPLRYGNVIPNKYKNAFFKELREQGLCAADYDWTWHFPQGVGMRKKDYPYGYTMSLYLLKY